jgi:hypothetical protein
VRSDKPDKHNAKIILHSNNEPVFIPFDVEHNPVFPYKAGISVNRFYIRWTPPIRMFDIMIPCP